MGSIPRAESQSHSLPPHAMPLISTPALLSAHLAQNPPVRPSGRAPLQPRSISVNTGSLTHTHGSSVVKIGGTSVVCGVRGEILPVSEIPSWSVKDAITRTTEEWERAEVKDDAHKRDDSSLNEKSSENEDALWQHNLLVPNISLDTGCSPLHPANTAPSVEQQSLSQRLLSLLLTSKLVRLRDLEIYHDTAADAASIPDPDTMDVEDTPAATLITTDPDDNNKTVKAFWVLYIDMLCISHAGSGSVFDAAWLALHAALTTTALPAARWDQDENRVVCYPSSAAAAVSSDIGRPRRLRLRGTPVPLSWGVHEPDKRVAPAGARPTLLVDLEGMEEEACQERGCVVVDLSQQRERDGETQVLRLEKSGGGAAGVEQVREVVAVAERRWKEWVQLVGGGN